jgi:hypothetical protein
MTEVGFEPTIPVFEQAKTVHALDSAATVMGVTVTNPAIKLFDIISLIQGSWRQQFCSPTPCYTASRKAVMRRITTPRYDLPRRK